MAKPKTLSKKDFVLAQILRDVLRDSGKMKHYEVTVGRSPSKRKRFNKDLECLDKCIENKINDSRRTIKDIFDDYFPIGHEPYRDNIQARVRRRGVPNDPEYTTVRISKNLKKKLDKVMKKKNLSSMEELISSLL